MPSRHVLPSDRKKEFEESTRIIKKVEIFGEYLIIDCEGDEFKCRCGETHRKGLIWQIKLKNVEKFKEKRPEFFRRVIAHLL